MSYYVSRQKYYYSGQSVIEIASGGIDSSGCDMLSTAKDSPMRRFEGDYANPIEAVDAAIGLQKLWHGCDIDSLKWGDSVKWLCYGCNLDIIEGSGDIPEDGLNDGGEEYTLQELIIMNRKDAKEWAQKEFEQLPKCARCGDIMSGETWQLPDVYEEEEFCSENCANNAYYDYEMEMYQD